MRTHLWITTRALILCYFLVACNERIRTDDRTNAEKFPCTWTTNTVELTLEVDGVPLMEYLTGTLGYSNSEATTIGADLEEDFVDEVTGTMKITDDGSFVSMFNEIDSHGTWSIAADDKSVTLVEHTAELVEFTILLVSDETLIVSITDDFMFDLDKDPATPDDVLSAEAFILFDAM